MPQVEIGPKIEGRLAITDHAIEDIVGWTVLECYGVVGMAAPNLRQGVASLLNLDRREAPYGRSRFVLVELAPAVLLTAALIVWVAIGPGAGWVIVPAAFHITACKMDIAYSIVVMRQPVGTLCRISEDGLELTEPLDYEVP